MLILGVECSICGAIDLESPVIAARDDAEAEIALHEIDWQSWVCPTCAAGAVHATIAELTA